MKRLWFFDLDGTLADTDRDIREAWKAALADMRISCPSFDRDFVAGPPIEEMARILFPDAYTPELGAELRRRFGEHYDNDGFPYTVEYPGIIERVKALKSAGATVVVAQAYGAKERETVEKAVHTSIAISIIGGIILGITVSYVSYRIIRKIYPAR